MAMPGTETIRFRRPTAGPNAIAAKKKPATDAFGSQGPKEAWKRRHQGLLQDQVGRQSDGPLVPSFSLAIRLLLLIRTASAMYANIQDCDEVFNFFEPLHYLLFNTGLQTWELSPEFALRSWSYILLHALPAWIPTVAMGLVKRSGFFAVRIFLGFICTFCEAKFYRAVVDNINERVGRYLLFGLMTSAGMWSASTAFLPSSFAMYATMLGYAYWMQPADSRTKQGTRRTYLAIAAFAIGAIVGWPFSLLLAVPFVVEQLFVYGDDVVHVKDAVGWRLARASRLVQAGVVAAGLAVPAILVDSYVYGRWVFPALNIVRYNLFSEGGPDLYGSEPIHFYLLNLCLNFNILALLALASGPALFVTYFVDFKRLGAFQRKPQAGESSPYTLVSLRLSGFYIWFTVLSLQKHKEERFMFPAYPLLLMNAAVTVFLVRGWLERIYIKITASPYEAGRSSLFSRFTMALAIIPAILSISRIYALGQFFHAPLDIAYHFQYKEIPTLLTAAGFTPKAIPEEYRERRETADYNDEWDYSVLGSFDPKIRICWGKEWYRFPGSFLVPEGVEIKFIKHEADMMMPREWEPSAKTSGMWPRQNTRIVPPGRFNNLNAESEEPGSYVDADTCTYIVDSYLPSLPPSRIQPAFIAQTDKWEVAECIPFLDAPSSKQLSRSFWLPGATVESGRVWGQYCLLRNRQTLTAH